MVGRLSRPVLVLLLATFAGRAAPVWAETATLSVEEVVARAAEGHPDVRTALADVQVAEGELRTARAFAFNPQASVAAGGRSEGEARDLDASLEQTIELGKRGKRTQAAGARLEAAKARLAWTRQAVAAGARRAYLLTVAARERLKAAREAEAVTNDLRSAAHERLTLGAGTQLEMNVAAAAAGRARAQRLGAERRLRQARTELAAAVNAPPGEEVDAAGGLPPWGPAGPSEDAFVARALAQRADLEALRHQRRAAEAEVALAGALAVPDPSFGVSYERSPGDKRLLFGVSIALPLWNRNQGGRAVAQALRTRATIGEDAARRAVERDTRSAYAVYALGRDTVQGFDRDVVDKLGENLDLARESFRAGKISLLEFNAVRRDLIDTQLAYLDALTELIEGRFALELAVGERME